MTSFWDTYNPQQGGNPTDYWDTQIRTGSPDQLAAYESLNIDPRTYTRTGGGPVGTYPTPASGVLSDTQQSAKTIIESALNQYGLGSLAEWAWTQYLAGWSVDHIMIELRQRPEYKTRFPAMETLAQRGRAISEGEYIGYERAAVQLMRQYGLPPGFYDQPEDFTNLLSGEVSIAELSQRLSTYQSLAYNQDQSVRDELRRLYNINEGDLAAYFIDPQRATALLERKAQAAQAAATSIHAGYGALSADQAEYLTQFSNENVATGLSNLAAMRELFTPVSLGEEGINQATQFGATFGGNAQARQAIETRQKRRVAEYQTGGGYTSSRQGISGIGAA